MWTGLDGMDVIYYNADWPELAVALTAHAAGHLLLGHCGAVREGGQFACVASAATCRRPEAAARRRLRGPVARLFSEPEERDADDFGLALLERTGWDGEAAVTPRLTSASMFGCIG